MYVVASRCRLYQRNSIYMRAILLMLASSFCCKAAKFEEAIFGDMKQYAAQYQHERNFLNEEIHLPPSSPKSNDQIFYSVDTLKATSKLGIASTEGIPTSPKGFSIEDFQPNGRLYQNVPPHQLQLDPSSLAFHSRPVCIPSVLSISIFNSDNSSQGLYIQSLTSEDPQFQPAAFNPFILKGGSNSTFLVVFLPSQQGEIIAKLVFHTSEKNFYYAVSGTGVPNHYNLTGLDATLPVGKRFSPLINMMNNNNKVLSVMEVFTTESFLHVDLPNSIQYHDKTKHNLDWQPSAKLWEIPTNTSKDIIMLSFMSPISGLFQGYVHIRTDQDSIILPVRLQVVAGGLYVNPNKIDFGIITSPEEVRETGISFENTGTSTIQIIKVAMEQTDKYLTVVLTGKHIIPPGKRIDNALVVIYSGNPRTERFHGRISIQTNASFPRNPYLPIDYVATSIIGSLLYRKRQLIFSVTPSLCSYSSDHNERWIDGRLSTAIGENVTRRITLTNGFDIPIKLLDVRSLSQEFIIINFTKAVIQSNLQLIPPLSILFQPRDSSHRIRKALIQVVTNISTHYLPLHIHTGRLNVYSTSNSWENFRFCSFEALDTILGECMPSHRVQDGNFRYRTCHGSVIDYGNMSAGSKRSHQVNISNLNPILINITSITRSNPNVLYALDSITLSSAASPDIALLAEEWRSLHPNFDQFVQETSMNILRKVKKSKISSSEGSAEDIEIGFSVQNIEQVIMIPPGHVATFTVRLRAPDKEEFVHGPGITFRAQNQVISCNIRYRSFLGNLELHDKVIQFDSTFPGKLQFRTVTMKNSFNTVAHVKSIRSIDRRVQLFLSNTTILPHSSSQIATIALSPAFSIACQDPQGFTDCISPPSIGEEAYALSSHGERITMQDIEAFQARDERFSSLVETGGNLIAIKVMIETDLVERIYGLVKARLIQPLLSTKNSTRFPITQVGNISESYIYVQNPSSMFVDVSLSIDSRDERIIICNESIICHSDWGPKELIHLNASTASVKTLPPNGNGTIGPIYYRPTIAEENHFLVYIRNSLSHIEPHSIVGVGGVGKLLIQSRKEHESYITADNEIIFTIDEKHIQEQDKILRNGNPSNFCSRDLRVENIGTTAMDVLEFSVERGIANSDYGFQLKKDHQDSFPFVLQPKESRSFSIKFIPDCLSSQVDGTLVVLTSLGVLKQRLVGYTADELLNLCLETRMREMHNNNFHFFLMIVLLSSGVVIISLFDVVLESLSLRSILQSRDPKDIKPVTDDYLNKNLPQTAKEEQTLSFSDKEEVKIENRNKLIVNKVQKKTIKKQDKSKASFKCTKDITNINSPKKKEKLIRSSPSKHISPNQVPNKPLPSTKTPISDNKYKNISIVETATPTLLTHATLEHDLVKTNAESQEWNESNQERNLSMCNEKLAASPTSNDPYSKIASDLNANRVENTLLKQKVTNLWNEKNKEKLTTSQSKDNIPPIYPSDIPAYGNSTKPLEQLHLIASLEEPQESIPFFRPSSQRVFNANLDIQQNHLPLLPSYATTEFSDLNAHFQGITPPSSYFHENESSQPSYLGSLEQAALPHPGTIGGGFRSTPRAPEKKAVSRPPGFGPLEEMDNKKEPYGLFPFQRPSLPSPWTSEETGTIGTSLFSSPSYLSSHMNSSLFNSSLLLDYCKDSLESWGNSPRPGEDNHRERNKQTLGVKSNGFNSQFSMKQDKNSF